MITFKQFIAEIDHSDNFLGKSQSHDASKYEMDASWKKLPVKDQIQNSQYEIYWRVTNDTTYKLALYDIKTKKIGVIIELVDTTVKVPGGSLRGVITKGLYSNERFRGKNLPYMMYNTLIENGQVLLSSKEQTTGSRKLWEKLVQSDVGEVFVMAEEATARWYMRKAPIKLKGFIGKLERVLLTGPFAELQEAAYGSLDAQWLILPKNLNGLDKFKELAIQLPQVDEELDEEKYQPEWEKPCWITAIHKTLGTSEDKIKKLATKHNWDGKSDGLPVKDVISIVWDLIGQMPDLSDTKTAKGMTPKGFSGTTKKTGLVFTRKHVMPMVHGTVSNFNGHGEEEIIVVATFLNPS